MSSSRSAAKKSPTSSRKTAKKTSTKKAAVKKTASKKVSAKKASTKKGKSSVASSSEIAEDPTVAMCRSLAEIVASHDLSELIVDSESLTLTIRRGAQHVIAPGHSVPTLGTAPMSAPILSAAAPAASSAAEVVDDDFHEVTSPFVGTFYRAANPDDPSYCEIGQRVEKGQTLCIIEAMKLMNEIEADKAGILEAVLVENAEPVEYGQPLFKIKA